MAIKSIILDDRDSAKAITSDDLAGVIAGVKAKVSAKVRADGSLVIAAAYATHTVARLRDDFNATKYGEEVGVHRSTVTMWQGLGIAVVDLGVEVGDDDWKRLAGGSGANTKPIAGILRGDGRFGDGKDNDGNEVGKGKVLPTREDLLWGIEIAFAKNEDGTLSLKKKPGKEIQAALEAAAGTSVALTPEQIEEARVKEVNARIKTSAEYLAKNLQDVTPEAWEIIRKEVAQVMAKAATLDATRQAAAEAAAA